MLAIFSSDVRSMLYGSYVVPMVVEEPSVVAAVSNIARMSVSEECVSVVCVTSR